MKKLMVLVLLLCMALMPTALAGDVWEMAESSEYGPKLGGMLGRGLINAASCFVDLAVQTVEKTQEGPPVVGTLTGIGSGAGCTILRAASGILDVAGSWVPNFNGIPVSKSYSNCLIEAVPAGEGDWQQAPSSSVKAPSYSQSSTRHDTMDYVKK